MKRVAFTMIELIFVIVILGILAVVAIPKLTGIEDDALVATEEAGIAAIRSSVITIHGVAMMHLTSNYKKEVTTNKGLRAFQLLVAPTAGVGTTTLSSTRYPSSLSLEDTSTVLADGLTTIATSQSEKKVDTLGLVMDIGNRESWTTGTPSATGDSPIEIIGPASTLLVAGQTQATLDNNGSWSYNPINGSIVWRASNAYSSIAN